MKNIRIEAVVGREILDLAVTPPYRLTLFCLTAR